MTTVNQGYLLVSTIDPVGMGGANEQLRDVLAIARDRLT